MENVKNRVYSLVQPRPSPKMDAIYDAMEQGFPNATRNAREVDRHILWGLIANNAEIVRTLPYVFVDMPYHNRLNGTDFENSYWRFCVDSLHDTRELDVPEDRFLSWGVEPQDWNTDGDYILVCPSSSPMTRLIGKCSVDQWIDNVTAQIEKFTDIPVKIRLKPRKNGTSGASVADVPLEEDLRGARVVVTLASIVGVEALLMGKPVFTTTKHNPVAWCGNTDFSKIEEPELFSDERRRKLFMNLAYKQFSIPELRDGTAFLVAKTHLGF